VEWSEILSQCPFRLSLPACQDKPRGAKRYTLLSSLAMPTYPTSLRTLHGWRLAIALFAFWFVVAFIFNPIKSRTSVPIASNVGGPPTPAEEATPRPTEKLEHCGSDHSEGRAGVLKAAQTKFKSFIENKFTFVAIFSTR
jgi:hypothetical protein